MVEFWSRVLVLDVGSHEVDSIIGEAKVCIIVTPTIQLVVPSSINTPGDWIIKLYCIQVFCSTYINCFQGLGLCGGPSDRPVLLIVELTTR